MGTMVKWFSQRSVEAWLRVRFPLVPQNIAMIPWKTLSDDEKKFVRFWLFVLGSGIAGVVVVLRWVVGVISA